MQCFLLILLLIDTFFLTAHYYYGLWPSSFEKNQETGKIYAIQNTTWLRLRISYKMVQIMFMTILLLGSCLVFRELIKVVKSDESLKLLKRQVYIFMTIFLSQLFIRYFGLLAV